MVRKMMLVSVLATLLGSFSMGAVGSAWAFPVQGIKHYGRDRTFFSEYKQWPESEQLRYVGWVMEGHWAAFQITGRYWASANHSHRETYQGCKVEPRALWEAIRDFPSPWPDTYPIRSKLFASYGDLCREDSERFVHGVTVTLHGDYLAWPEPQQRAYVDAVMIGIEEAFHTTGEDWPRKTRAVLRDCDMTQPPVSGVLAKTAGPKDGKRSVAKLVFAAYETACREAKGK